jgi:hypothetical protein
MVDIRDNMTQPTHTTLSEMASANSLASRVASSATYLAKNVVRCSRVIELPASLASGSGPGSKASTASFPVSESNSIADLPTRSSQSSIYSNSGSSNTIFRSTSKGKAREDEFEAFMSTCTPVSTGVDSAVSAFSTPSILADETGNMDSNWKLSTYSQHPSTSTFDWTAVLTSHTNDMWPLESSTAAPPQEFKKEEVQKIVSGPAQSDDHALFRLRLILGHITDTVHPTSSVWQHHSALRIPHSHDRLLTIRNTPRHSHLDQTSSVSMSSSATKHAFHYEHSSATGQRDMFLTRHQASRRSDSPRMGQNMDEECSSSALHCSWDICRKVSSLATLINSGQSQHDSDSTTLANFESTRLDVHPLIVLTRTVTPNIQA